MIHKLCNPSASHTVQKTTQPFSFERIFVKTLFKWIWNSLQDIVKGEVDNLERGLPRLLIDKRRRKRKSELGNLWNEFRREISFKLKRLFTDIFWCGFNFINILRASYSYNSVFAVFLYLQFVFVFFGKSELAKKLFIKCCWYWLLVFFLSSIGPSFHPVFGTA